MNPRGKRWSHDTREEVDKLVAALEDARELFAQATADVGTGFADLQLLTASNPTSYVTDVGSPIQIGQ